AGAPEASWSMLTRDPLPEGPEHGCFSSDVKSGDALWGSRAAPRWHLGADGDTGARRGPRSMHRGAGPLGEGFVGLSRVRPRPWIGPNRSGGPSRGRRRYGSIRDRPPTRPSRDVSDRRRVAVMEPGPTPPRDGHDRLGARKGRRGRPRRAGAAG